MPGATGLSADEQGPGRIITDDLDDEGSGHNVPISNSSSTSTTSSTNDNPPQQSNGNGQQRPEFVTGNSMLMSHLNAPLLQPQRNQMNSRSHPGMHQNVMMMSQFQGQNGGSMGMSQQQMMRPQMQQNPYHQLHHPMDNQHHSQAPQMNMGQHQQQVPPGPYPQFNMNHHSQQHAFNQQSMPFGMPSSNFIGNGGGNQYGNLVNPQMAPFQPHGHVNLLNQQQQPNPMNRMQMQQPPSAGFGPPHGHHPPFVTFQQQQPVPVQGPGMSGGGWVDNGHPMVANNNGSNLVCPHGCSYKRGKRKTSSPPAAAPTPATPRPPPIIKQRRAQGPAASPDPNIALRGFGRLGGLEILWRELPPAGQQLMTQQDIPNSARERGYFTVFELLSLKRTLLSRLSSGMQPTQPLIMTNGADNIVGNTAGKQNARKGPKKKPGPKRGYKRSEKAPKVKYIKIKAEVKEEQDPDDSEALPKDGGDGSNSVARDPKDEGNESNPVARDPEDKEMQKLIPQSTAEAETETDETGKPVLELASSADIEQCKSNEEVENSESSETHSTSVEDNVNN